MRTFLLEIPDEIMDLSSGREVADITEDSPGLCASWEMYKAFWPKSQT